MRELLIQEIQELTAFIRSSDGWAEIRELIIKGGFDPEISFLAAFLEGEKGEEWGVVVTPECRVFQWFRNTDDNTTTTEWREITESVEDRDMFPQIEVALSLLMKN